LIGIQKRLDRDGVNYKVNDLKQQAAANMAMNSFERGQRFMRR
jgi:hypothetical protein